MFISNKEEYKEIPISELKLSTRTYNALMRKGYRTLFSVIEHQKTLEDVPNLGRKSIDEIEEVLSKFSNGEIEAANNESDSTSENENLIEQRRFAHLSEDLLNKPAVSLNVSERICHAFSREGIETIGQVIRLTSIEILNMKNIGAGSQQELLEQIDLLCELGESYFSGSDGEESGPDNESSIGNRRFDIDTAKKLREHYGLKTETLCKWYKASRQRISQLFYKRNNRGQWCGKQLLPDERGIITDMINARSFYREEAGKEVYLFNNKTDDCAFVIVTDQDIKCFFLDSLPEAVQALLKSYSLHRLSSSEIELKDRLGKTVTILKTSYFIPNDTLQFRKMASERGLSVEDYSMYLFGIPYSSPNTTITDERIITYLRENTVNGRTFIPSSSDSQWLRTFISRSPYNTNEFIAFYGFSTETPVESREISFGDLSEDTIEKDMQQHQSEGDYIQKLYDKNPLLGSAIISPNNLEILNRNSKKCITQIMDSSYSGISLKGKMQIALSVINYAKEWDTENESGFWKYITEQFGFRDESGKLRRILCECIKDALLSNGRFFLSTTENQYRSSIVMHALSPKRSWIRFCDFLYDFYVTNLAGEYIEEDPIISRMVLALQRKFRNTEETADEDIEISSKVYHFRESIIKLILYRPRYATLLVSNLLKRIDGLIKHSVGAASCYEEYLCDEWIADKLQRITIEKQQYEKSEGRSIAIDYTKIKPIYRLDANNKVSIVFPAVRIAKNAFSSLVLSVYHKENLVEQRTLKYYGNELGWTMSGFSLSLEDYIRRSASKSFDPRVMITCDSDVIYDSDKILFRDCIAFDSNREISLDSIKQGGYTLFVPNLTIVDSSNAEFSVITENNCLKGLYYEFQEGFSLTINGKLLAFETVQSGDAPRVIVDAVSRTEYVRNGISYHVFSEHGMFRIISAGENDVVRYQLMINDEIRSLNSLPCSQTNGANVYQLETRQIMHNEVVFRLVDLAKNKIAYSYNYKIIPGFDYGFNRSFYFSDSDYRDARARVRVNSESVKEYSITKDDSQLSVAYEEGEILIPAPVISVTDNRNTVWDGTNRYWIKAIPQDCFLNVDAPAGLTIDVSLDGVPVEVDDNKFAVGNAVYGYVPSPEKSWINLRMTVTGNDKSYSLGRIATKEQFLGEIVFKLENNQLRWNRGYGFIGDSTGNLQLNIFEGTSYEASFKLNLEDELIAEGLDVPIGIYQFSIKKSSGNLFSRQLKTITTGNVIVGDYNELRFRNQIIKINTITFENDDTYEEIFIRPCYIDQIEYRGIQFVDSEDRECPVYNGIMYYIGATGKRHEFSREDTKDKDGNLLYQINPVTIVYINKNTLSMVNEFGDGFYYYRTRDVYSITDREPVRIRNRYTGKLENPKNYYAADLYSYTVEGV